MVCQSIIVSSPVGFLKVSAENNRITSIEFVNEQSIEESDLPVLTQAKNQLEEYFSGSRKTFDLPLEMKGTTFQKLVWNQLLEVPYGQTCSYQDIANQIANPKAVRAIGQANKANAIPIVIPCHRVIGKNQSLTGYAGKEIDKKEKLLSLEKQYQ
ncbi:methylated-DNA--[protein]-cysteine S-methyltransferase [Bacillus pakistanensis]|uniref:methylated-DNA--[protein]-cysteine S-methyltransferase n=1 Tax=Rossellomorea pakistanensis TaxID=992288 RepID=UPI0019669C21|nr:methylated-DNA--[protein]-cysteine S-methyltransferase [Bacillus pakistanensis]